MMAQMVTVEEQVSARNAEFYAAFEARDLDVMAELWEHSDRVTVTHPGWPTLRGWARVGGSWDAIFANTPYIQFVLTEEVVSVAGEVAWVTLDENILQAHATGPSDPASEAHPAGQSELAGGELSGASVAATNVFVLSDGVWRMVVHHGSSVAVQDPH
jgi:ketosteroid isomerase-like protein